MISEELTRCMNPQPGAPSDFWSRFSSCSPRYASTKPQGSSASFGPPQVFYFPGTRHIWWAFPYPPPGEVPVGRLATSHGVSRSFKYENKFFCGGGALANWLTAPCRPASKAILSPVKRERYNFRSSTLKVVISFLLEALCSVELRLWLLKMLAPVYVHVLSFVAMGTQCFLFYITSLSIYCTLRRTL